ncbi:MAG: beta-L-arabinofuranosidase domain-containing protein [Candidatus Brocadiia bacterium]
MNGLAIRCFLPLRVGPLAALCLAAALGGQAEEAAQEALAPSAVRRLGGLLARRVEANARLLAGFDPGPHLRRFEEQSVRGWEPAGQGLGQWLEAAVLAAEHTADAELARKARRTLRRLLEAQDEDGYLGVTPRELRSGRQPIRGMEALELAATLDALLAAAEHWDDAAALEAAQRLADWLVERVGPGKAAFWPLPREVTIAGEPQHFGLDAAVLAGPLARLARLAGEERYAEWSRWVGRSIDRWSGAGILANLRQVAEGRLGLHQVLPLVPPHELHASLLALLEVPRSEAYGPPLREAQAAWRAIVGSRMYRTGGVGLDGRYHGPHHLPNAGRAAATEATLSWLRLNQRLLELTGEARFAHVVERLVWNQVPAAQRRHKGWRSHTPLAGADPEGPSGRGPASGPLLMALLPTLLYARSPDGVAVNQYAESEATVRLPSGNEVAVRQRTDYPAGQRVLIELAMARPEAFVLRLRLPAWCAEPAVAVNGQPLDSPPEPGSFLALRRRWASADRIELTLPMEARWLPGAHGNDGLYALVRGPVVYAVDTAWCDEPTRQALAGEGGPLGGLGGVALDPREPTAGLAAAPCPEGVLGPVYRVRIALRDGRRALATLAPFANVGAAPGAEGRRHGWAVWVGEATSGRFRTVDLSGAANVHSNSGRGLFSSPLRSEESFPFSRYGRYRLGGVPFHVLDPAAHGGRNLLVLDGGPADAPARRYPRGAAVAVGFRCRAIHILGAVGGWAHPAHRGSGRRGDLVVRIRYEDAPTQEHRLRNGVHLADYAARHDVPGSAFALDVGGRQLRTLRIRTHSRSPVARIELRDTGTVVAPVVAAVTAELPRD